MANILITGGAGNLGSALAQNLCKDKNNFLVLLDDLSTGKLTNIPRSRNVLFIKANVNQFKDVVSIFGRFQFDYVFHYAAVVGVKRTLENPIRVMEDIEGIKNILTLSKNSAVKRVFYSSSSEVYGEPFEVPQNENTTPLNSRLPYAIVKNVGEALFKAYYAEYGLSYTIFRFFNTYGPNQSEDFVIPRFVNLAMRGLPIPINGNGLQTRSFCYVQDNIDTCVKALYNEQFVNDILNVGNDNEMTILELAERIIKVSVSSSEILFLPALEEGDMKRRCPDITKMRGLLNRELISLEEGILKLVHHYQQKEKKIVIDPSY